MSKLSAKKWRRLWRKEAARNKKLEAAGICVRFVQIPSAFLLEQQRREHEALAEALGMGSASAFEAMLAAVNFLRGELKSSEQVRQCNFDALAKIGEELIEEDQLARRTALIGEEPSGCLSSEAESEHRGECLTDSDEWEERGIGRC